jgi:hypothetical protein
MANTLLELKTRLELWWDEVTDRFADAKPTIEACVELERNADNSLTLVLHRRRPSNTGSNAWLQLYTYGTTGKKLWARVVPPHSKLNDPAPLTAANLRGHMPPLGSDQWEEALMGPCSDSDVDADLLWALRCFGDALTRNRKVLTGNRLQVPMLPVPPS